MFVVTRPYISKLNRNSLNSVLFVFCGNGFILLKNYYNFFINFIVYHERITNSKRRIGLFHFIKHLHVNGLSDENLK